jgi:hypothetical protein
MSDETANHSNIGNSKNKIPIEHLRKQCDERFVDLVAQGVPPGEAHRQSAGTTSSSANQTGFAKMNKPHISAAIEERKAFYRSLANVEAEHVIGALQEMAFSSIEDSLDERGNFDFQKAKENGALKLVKKITTRTGKRGEDGEPTWKETTVELYSRADALSQLAEVLGLKKAPQKNNPRTRLIEAIEKVMKVDNCSFALAWEYIRRRQEEGGVQLFPVDLMEQVAKEHNVQPAIDIGATEIG